MSPKDLFATIQETMDAQFKAGFAAGKMSVIFNVIHPESDQETPAEEPSNDA